MIVKEFLKVVSKRMIILFEISEQNRNRLLLYEHRCENLPQEWENREISLISLATTPNVILKIYVK